MIFIDEVSEFSSEYMSSMIKERKDHKNKFNFVCASTTRKGMHYFNIELQFRSFGINPDKFKNKRHLKKFYKKYVLPILKKQHIS